MPERLYTDYPDIYDAIQSDWEYDRDIDFVEEVQSACDVTGTRLLEVGCGTGEHTRRFAESGFAVTAIDKYEGMLRRARTKCDADFRRQALPDLDIDGVYDVVVAIRGVVNHLPPEHLSPALGELADHLAEEGVVIFDNSPLPPSGNHPAIDVGATDGGDYGRIAQHVPTGDGRLDWRSITMTTDGDFFVNSRLMTPFDDDTITETLVERGLTVETFDGYGEDDSRTVFVASQ